MKQTHPPEGAPKGTVWFGGPVDGFRITLRVAGEGLDPDHINSLLNAAPTKVLPNRKAVKLDGTVISFGTLWSLDLSSDDCESDADVEDAIRLLLSRLTSDLTVWKELTQTYRVDLFCGIYLKTTNRGFEISTEVLKLLSERNLTIGFDIYYSQKQQ